ncbi:LOW QUALITY PROTEIN: NFATC2-interacting protein [Perognathus longimembris pacificus]|uniref:LOW QUALITY PROTEIN: NFATC2-interacting protein n=1 Tax=Perognathus longimembris pacificus TaxID=214514 RepID=UPI002019B161|nr:LOW QUALITY PROTEIN: NFATC2-interacting protein [Perognathus longimembris pacificus]
MAEPLRRRGRRLRGGRVGRGARGTRGGRGRPPDVQRPPVRHTLDPVFVDLVSDSDEEPAGVSAEPVAVPPRGPAEPPGPAARRPDSDSDSEGSGPRTVVRRRRRLLLDPGEAPVVPVYSGKVQSSFNLIPDDASLLKLYPAGAEEETDMADFTSPPHSEELPVPSSSWKSKLRSKNEKEEKAAKVVLVQDSSPSPPPLPRNKSRKHTRALQKLREVNKRLRDLQSCLSPKQSQSHEHLNQDDEVVLVEGPVLPENPRIFRLKIRCRAEVVRLPIKMSEPLQRVVDHMAAHLRVSPSRILLLFGETELSPTATPRSLKLGVADIIDCVVLASPLETAETSQELQLHVQGKEKHQKLEISLAQDSPLQTLMSRYEEAMGLSGHKLSFFYDGTKLSGKELPADLGMESGDLIEVWG